MTHSHSHAHDHADHAHDDHAHGPGGHVHAPANFGPAFAVGIVLNTAFVIVEAIYGYTSNSTALIADAGHNLSDVLGLVVAWIAVVLSKRPPSARYTYGLRGSSILAALFNAVFLLIAVGAIGWEAILRLLNPEPMAETTVMIVATIGIAINGFTAWLFASGSKDDLNIRGAYLHMAADAAVSASVVIAAIVIMFTGWLWLDPVTSPRYRCRHRVGHMGTAARQYRDVAGRGAVRHRSGRGSPVSRTVPGRDPGLRPAHLADEHNRGRIELSSGHARGPSGRYLSASGHASPE